MSAVFIRCPYLNVAGSPTKHGDAPCISHEAKMQNFSAMKNTSRKGSWGLFRYKRLLRYAIILLVSICLIAEYIRVYNLKYAARVYYYSQPGTATCPSSSSSESLSCKTDHKKETIPNIAHFVYILRNPENDQFPIQFSHFLSIYSAWLYWRPDIIYLHTNVEANSTAVQLARDGSSGKWAQRLFNTPTLRINTVSVPTNASNGHQINGMEHKSDFVRVKAVQEFGGIYIDLDVHALRDIKPLREAGYGAIGGFQKNSDLNSGTFMSVKGGALINNWEQRMNEVYNGGWTVHSNSALTDVAKELNATASCEVLGLDQSAFAPFSWDEFDTERLFLDYYSDSGLAKSVASGKALPDYPDPLRGNKWIPSWKRDWSCSYLLHAFSSKKARYGVKDDGISPKSVLARQSIFSRAVYPVLKHMYENGVIDARDFA